MEAAWAGLTVEESNLAVQIAAYVRCLGRSLADFSFDKAIR
jgi:hypothetical protein